MSTPPHNSAKRYVRTLALWVLVVYWIALFIGTHVPPSDVPNLGRHGDKVLHFGAYAGLAFLACSLFWARAWPLRATVLLVVPMLLGYGVLDEFLQMFVGRNAEVWDWVADTIGVLIGTSTFVVVRPVLERLFPPGRRFPTW